MWTSTWSVHTQEHTSLMSLTWSELASYQYGVLRAQKSHNAYSTVPVFKSCKIKCTLEKRYTLGPPCPLWTPDWEEMEWTLALSTAPEGKWKRRSRVEVWWCSFDPIQLRTESRPGTELRYAPLGEGLRGQGFLLAPPASARGLDRAWLMTSPSLATV